MGDGHCKITQAQIDDQEAQNETAPGADTTGAGPSTDLQDYLNPWEISAGDQIAEAIARAALTPDMADDIAALTNQRNLAQEIESRVEAGGAPVPVITQTLQGIKDARDALDQAVSGSSSPTADQSAQLAQAQQQAQNAQANAASAEAALTVLKNASDLGFNFGRGSGASPATINVGVKALRADSASVQRQVGAAVANAFGAQPYIASSTGTYRG